MKEIKFRHFDKKTGYFCYFKFGQIMTDFQRAIYDEICINGGDFEQFTGAIDKEGNEIYEGDLVEVNEGDKRKKGKTYSTKVAFKNFSFCLDVNRTKIIDSMSLVCANKVIGNIHEQ